MFLQDTFDDVSLLSFINMFFEHQRMKRTKSLIAHNLGIKLDKCIVFWNPTLVRLGLEHLKKQFRHLFCAYYSLITVTFFIICHFKEGNFSRVFSWAQILFVKYLSSVQHQLLQIVKMKVFFGVVAMFFLVVFLVHYSVRYDTKHCLAVFKCN